MSIQRSGVLTLEGFVETFDQSFITKGLSHEAKRSGAWQRTTKRIRRSTYIFLS
jgi:hypothetical protein